MMIEIVSNSPEETFSLGKQISSRLSESSVIALRGVLGSGKTCMVKGIALGLGITENITSPTYTIVNEYAKEDTTFLYHIDAYRLSNDKDFEDIGGNEILNSGGISIIEWSERIPNSIPSDSIIISMEITGDTSRLIKINGMEKL